MKFVASEEKIFLDSLVNDYTDESPYSKVKKDIIHSLMNEYIKQASSKAVLQLGCSNGYETGYLTHKFKQVDVIDGSSKFIEKIKKKSTAKNCNFILTLFEEYSPSAKKYDYIFCNYVLEHIFDVPVVLKNMKKLLKENGKIFATVPNATAFSRRLAQQIGLVGDLYALTENDIAHGHRRVYNLDKLKQDFQKAGFDIVATRGVIFKILADFQLNKMLHDGLIAEEHVWGLQKMSVGNEDFCDSIFTIAQ
jgi:2-polyprenyl-3-methyl-5-hydroxy-6-metoxy-1,4-benzoquinol methylase